MSRDLVVGRTHTRTLMSEMGIHVLYPKPSTSKPSTQDRRYPYLIRGLDIINHTNHVWEMDITYIPMRKELFFLVAVMDAYIRFVLSGGLSNTMDAEWCKEIAENAFKQYGRPEILNTDQGSQFTSKLFTDALEGPDPEYPLLRISHDGKGRATDDIYIERFWRSLKYEDIYLKVYTDGAELYQGISSYIDFYKNRRPHQSLNYRTPSQIFFKTAWVFKLNRIVALQRRSFQY